MQRIPLDEIAWEDRFVRAFPGDRSEARTSRQIIGACYATVAPTAVADPRLLCWSPEAAQLIGVASPKVASPGDAASADPNPSYTALIAEVLGGNRVLPGMRPYAAAYAGHQFGSFAGQLGDGRAMTLGELVAPDGQRWDVQLKGAGPTPYSRRADGRAVLRSSVREFLCSEAMHHLGVPTTRALGLVTTGERVVRDMFYDGRPRAEPGAVVCRLAPTFIRFGTFELLSWREELPLLRQLTRFVIEQHFPELARELPPAEHASAPLPGAVVAAWFGEICRRTAVMVTHWMRVGFVHGVMNTDNMSILGLTIDYGPYGWLDPFDPDFTPNTTDASTGRYRFGMQPGVAQWNLAQLARALLPLCEAAADREALAAGLELYRATFQRQYGDTLLAKLGLARAPGVHGAGPALDEPLVNDLLALLAAEETDFTLWFRCLANLPLADDCADDVLLATMAPAAYAALSAGHRAAVLGWLRRYAARARTEPPEERAARMAAVNPVFILRNYLVHQAIEQAEKSDPARPDTSFIERLLRAARAPYHEGP
ncbi:MAG TPA: YdiU family protein, partial [Kofleriaceae bacterium]|nr:YdiU family protein [Kofleriaceae bacterium]